MRLLCYMNSINMNILIIILVLGIINVLFSDISYALTQAIA